MGTSDGVIDCATRKREEFDERSEASYRRGYHQGVAAALEALKAEFNIHDIEDWERRVRAWRSKKHLGKPEFPEWLARTCQSCDEPVRKGESHGVSG